MKTWKRLCFFWARWPANSKRRWLRIGLAAKVALSLAGLALVSGRSFSTLVPARTDRATFVGQTGSGKTTLAEMLCSQRDFVVAYDPKGRLDWDGYHLHTSLGSLVADRHPRLIYRPTYDELEDARTGSGELADQFFEWIYRRERTTLYVDELYSIARGDNFPHHYGACLTRGRELDIETWTATQRPSFIPGIVLSEAEHLYIFTLKLGRDRVKMEAETGIPAEAIRALPKHAFFYAPQSGAPVGPLTLALSSREAHGVLQEA